MDVKFVTTERKLLDTIPIVDGQLIVIKDSSDMLYDMYEKRHRVGPPVWEGINSSVDFGYISNPTISVIEFDVDGGEYLFEDGGTPHNVIVGVVGEEIADRDMPTPTKNGFVFNGWKTFDGYNYVEVTELPERFELGRTVYVADWKR